MKAFMTAGPRLAGVLLILCFLLSSGNASAAATWQDVRSSMALRGLASNGTVYVGAAANGIWTSKDLKTWTQVTLPASAGVLYNDVIWDGSQFIAVGNGLISSADGATWTVGSAPSAAEFWNAIAQMSGTYVVVGSDAGSVLRSTDGKNWTLVSTGFTVGSFSYLQAANGSKLGLSGIATNGSGFVVMGYQYSMIGSALSQNADIIATSADGLTWSPAAVPSSSNGPLDSFAANDVAWGASVYVAGGNTGVYTSPDGTTWTMVPFPTGTSGFNNWLLDRIQYSNGQFIGVGQDINSGEYAAFTSPDGSTWTEHAVAAELPSFQGLSAIQAVGTGYAVGGDYAVYSTTDLSTWTQTASAPETAISGCVVYGNGKFLIAGDGGSLSSADGSAWPSNLNKGTGTLFLQAQGDGQGCAAFGSGSFVMVNGFGGELLQSSDGANWTRVGPNTSLVMNYASVAFTGSEFVAVATQNTGTSGVVQPDVLISSDGKTWGTPVSATGLPGGIMQFGSVENPGTGLVYTNGQLVAWGMSTTNTPFISVSADGKSWSTVTLFGAGDTVSAIAFGNGKYMALGYDGSGNTLAASSSDALHWTQVSGVATGMHAHWATLIWGNNEFVAGGRNIDSDQGLILVSSDGTSWASTPLGSAGEVGGIAWNGTSYVAVSFYDIFEYTPPASSGSGGGGTPPPTNTGSSGGGGAFDILALGLLSGFAIRRRERWMRA